MSEKIFYFDIISGILGDMIFVSLLNLGVFKEIFLEEIYKLRMSDEFNINISLKIENGIVGIKVEVIIKEKYMYRNLVDIFEVIDKSILNENVKFKVKKIFMVIGEVEVKVYGIIIDKIYFYEVGVIDLIVDIVGVFILVDLFCVDKVCVSIVFVGLGFVKCEYGIIFIFVFVIIEILKGVLIKLNNVNGECIILIGVVIIKVLCDEFVDEFEFFLK